MDTVIRVQIVDEAICISHSTSTIGEDINPTQPKQNLKQQTNKKE